MLKTELSQNKGAKMKHKVTIEMRSTWASAECVCGWNYFLNKVRGEGNRTANLREKYNNHLKESGQKEEATLTDLYFKI